MSVSPARARATAVTTIALVVALAGCAAPSAPIARDLAAPPALGAPEKAADVIAMLAEESDDALATLVASDQPGCSAAVAVRGELVWAEAAGLADLASATPLTPETRFDMASLSKQFTATAILLLERDGLLALTDPVSRYIDGLPAWGDTVTLEALMHHTARIPDYWVELGREGIGFTEPADQSATLAAIARERELEPGEGYFYSNSHYVLLATVVERVSGQSLRAFLAERIVAPLELDLVLAPALLAPDIAISYETDLSIQQGAWTAYGHTGIIATPSDLAVWGDQYRTGEIVQDDFAAGAVSDGEGARYGAGIYLNDDGTLSHSGRWGGYLSNFRVSVDRETVMAVACNGRGANRSELADALWQIWAPAP